MLHMNQSPAMEEVDKNKKLKSDLEFDSFVSRWGEFVIITFLNSKKNVRVSRWDQVEIWQFSSDHTVYNVHVYAKHLCHDIKYVDLHL